MSVYAVSSGDYDDYCVHRIYERREDAVAALEAEGRTVAWEDYFKPEHGPSPRWCLPGWSPHVVQSGDLVDDPRFIEEFDFVRAAP